MTTRVFTGLKPTGRLQIGNYLGAIRPLLDLAADSDHEVVVSVVDQHALTVEHDPAALRAHTVEMAATLLACGLDSRATLFVQSSVPAHTDLAYLLECTATYGEMTRMIQFKEKSHGQDSVRLSLLTYPALMAADILAYQTDVVPVGEDQRQHLELTTTLARRFNSRYGPVFTVPRALTPPTAARIKDLRDPTSKMGKTGSDGAGVLFLRDTPDVLAAKIRRAVTDTDPDLRFDPVSRPGVANLAILLAAPHRHHPAGRARRAHRRRRAQSRAHRRGHRHPDPHPDPLRRADRRPRRAEPPARRRTRPGDPDRRPDGAPRTRSDRPATSQLTIAPRCLPVQVQSHPRAQETALPRRSLLLAAWQRAGCSL